MIFRLFIEVNPLKVNTVYLACVFSDLMIICIKPVIILHADCQSYVLCTYRERDLTYICTRPNHHGYKKDSETCTKTLLLGDDFLLFSPMIYCCVAPVDVWDMRYTVLYIFSVNDAPAMVDVPDIRRRRKKRKVFFSIIIIIIIIESNIIIIMMIKYNN